MGLKERLEDPRSPDRRPRRAAYALPTLFTAGNIFLGYISILRSFRGAMLAASGAAGAPEHFTIAAQAIGAAVFLDGLDGRIARMTNTTSDFGREMDSLADVISFGIAPAVLAFAWGVQFVDPGFGESLRERAFQRRLLRLVSVPAVRRAAPGALQRPEESDPQEPRPSRPQVFRGPADPRRRAAWWPRWCMPATREPSPGGRFRWRGWRCWRCSDS